MVPKAFTVIDSVPTFLSQRLATNYSSSENFVRVVVYEIFHRSISSMHVTTFDTKIKWAKFLRHENFPNYGIIHEHVYNIKSGTCTSKAYLNFPPKERGSSEREREREGEGGGRDVHTLALVY